MILDPSHLAYKYMEKPTKTFRRPPKDYLVTKESLEKKAEEERGQVIFPIHRNYAFSREEIIMAKCFRGHTWQASAGSVLTQWCQPCSILDAMDENCADGMLCTQLNYVGYQKMFIFMCKYEHRSVLSKTTGKKGCPICELGRKVGNNIKLDINCLYVHNTSRIRMHCIACDQDFYGTAFDFDKGASNQIFNCEINHHPGRFREVAVTGRAFEILFDDRFDDDTNNPKVYFTGYNNRFKIAYTHLICNRDTEVINEAVDWCGKNGVRFIQIPASITDTSKIVRFIVRHLVGLLEITESIHSQDIVYKNLRETMRQWNKDHKAYKDRCVFAWNKY